MKDILALLIFMLPAIILSIGAVWMMKLGVSGWGWLLFVIVLLVGSTSYHSSGDESKTNVEDVK